MNSVVDVKETGLEWIGSIPENWGLKKIKYIFWERKENNDPIQSDNLISLTIEKGVIPHSEKTGGGNKPKEDLSKYKLVYPGDIVLNSMNVIAGAVGISKYFGIVSPVYYMLIPKNNKHLNEYFHHLFRTETFQKSLYGLGNGILIKENVETGKLNTIRMRIPMDKLGDQRIPVPPHEEQKLISRYLDKKTSQIDSLVEKIQKKIELLQEQRTSLINHYVTKGLDPNVEMKDSGVEWIGEIPKHWESLPIRYVTEDHRQGFYTSDPYDNEGVPILRITDIQEDHAFSHWDSPKYSRPEEELDKFYVKNGDFLFPRTGGVGRFGIVDFDFPCIYGSFMIRFRWDRSINRNFMKFFLESSLFTDQVKQEIHGGVNQNVHVENIKDVTFFRPQLEEQSDISKHLQKKCSLIDQKISLEKNRFSLLSEYRQSLISSVVTGKVRVTEEMI